MTGADDIGARKQAVRKQAFARRKVVHDAIDGTAATGYLLEFLAPYHGRAMSAYMPIRTEIDPLPTMTKLAENGPVGVPVIQGPGQPLIFHLWQPETAMVPGPFGAMVPAEGQVMTPEIVILPLVAFDKRGYRLGYGGGFYDRTLELLRRNGPVLAVGFAYAAQQAPDPLPVEPTDQPMDAVVTEKGVMRFSTGGS